MLLTMLVLAAVAGAWYYGTLTTYERYAAVMAYRRARDSGKLTAEAKWFAVPSAARALVTDATYNWIMGWWPFLLLGNPLRAIPREARFTHYLERQIRGGGVRGRLARWMCRGMLDPLDPDGKHCD